MSEKGGPPMPRIMPQRPEREPTGRVVLQRPAPPLPKPGRQPPKPPGMPPLPKRGVPAPRRDSPDPSLQDFFRAKPSPEPPAEEADGMPSHMPSSIDISFDEPGSEPPKAIEQPQAPARAESGPAASALSRILKMVRPGLGAEPLAFTEEGVFSGTRKIGDSGKTGLGPEFRVWMHRIGYSPDSLPASALFGLFNISTALFADAARRANYVSIWAKSTGENEAEVKLCFHKEETPQAFLSSPLRISRRE